MIGKRLGGKEGMGDRERGIRRGMRGIGREWLRGRLGRKEKKRKMGKEGREEKGTEDWEEEKRR